MTLGDHFRESSRKKFRCKTKGWFFWENNPTHLWSPGSTHGWHSNQQILSIRSGKWRRGVQRHLSIEWRKYILFFLSVHSKFKEQVIGEFVIMPPCASKDSLMMVAVLYNAPEESLNSKGNVICAITPAWTAVEMNLTNAPLVEQVRKISSCSFFPLLGIQVSFLLCFQDLLEPAKQAVLLLLTCLITVF